MVHVELGNRSIDACIEYTTSILSERQAEHIATAFDHMLSLITLSSAEPLARLNIIPQLHQDEVEVWNQHSHQELQSRVHEVFEARVAKKPDAIAVATRQGNLTFREISDMSNRLAHHLVGLGVGPDVLVPVLFEKSVWSLISWLAISKAGGAFVPMDIGHPKTRLDDIVSTCDASLILASTLGADRLSHLDTRIVPVDQGFIDTLPETTSCPQTAVAPHNAAVVIFTSGTTGKPKGIVLEHAAVCSASAAQAQVLDMGPGTRVLQFASYTFDISILDMYTNLMAGGCVCIPSDHERMSNLSGFINDMGVNWACLTTTVASLLDPASVPGLKTLVLAGEAVTREALSSWANALQLYNGYGPAECSLCTAYGPMRDHDDPTNIGLGLETHTWVVDPSDYNRLMPIGAVGELLIETPFMARGYLNDPEKTNAGFIYDPSWSADGSGRRRRMYKSGDLVRYNTDGTMVYLGRKDAQVKINGQRVETSEIEYQVKANFSKASQVAVDLVPLPGLDARKVLVAFLCIEDSSAVDDIAGSLQELFLPISDDLRPQLVALEAELSTRLPGYMVPSMYIPVSNLPLSIAGKLDRRTIRARVSALTSAEVDSYSLTESSQTPSEGGVSLTDLQSRLQALWHQVLRLSQGKAAGLGDNFFRLGGDSLSAMKLSIASRKAGLSLSVADIFREPTLGQMAANVVPLAQSAGETDGLLAKPFSLIDGHDEKTVLRDSASQCSVPVESILDIFPCTPLQEGLMVLSSKEPGSYVAQNVFKLGPEVDIERFKKAWEETVTTTEILRTMIVHHEAVGSLQVVVDVEVSWEDSVLSLDAYLSSNKNTSMVYGELLSRQAIVRDDTAAYFVWTAHHCVFDGWCIPILLEKLSAIYDGNAVPSSTSFKSFIHHLQGSDKDGASSFWRRQLEGSKPGYFPQPSAQKKIQAVPVESIATHLVRFSPGASDITPSTILLAAWALVVARNSDQDDFTFGATVTGRNASLEGIDTMVGPTITTVPVRVRIERDKRIVEFLEDLQATSTERIPFEHFGLQNISALSADAKSGCGFHNVLVVQPEPEEAACSAGGLDIQHSTKGGMSGHTLPLLVECGMGSGVVNITARYNPDCITTEYISRVLHQFEHVIKQLVSGAEDRALRDIDHFGPHDIAQLAKWNADVPQTVEACIHELIGAQAAQQPNKQAICSGDESLTYAELDDLSTRLSNHLISLGVVAEMIVPLCFEKSAWTIVSMLAVLKSGAAFVALDPSHPIDRLNGIVNDTRASVILTSPSLKDLLDTADRVTVQVNRNALEAMPRPSESTMLRTTATPDNAAYLIFTSGSTGKPKGTILEHRAFCSSSLTHGKAQLTTASSRVLQFSSYAFDASLVEILTTLIHGACVCVLSEEERVGDIVSAMNRMDVNWAVLTPSFISQITPQQVPQLKTLVLAGEAMSRRDVELWGAHVDLVNGYGPCECAVVSVVNSRVTAETDPKNIGRPTGNRCWVVDASDHSRLTPIGCVGELAIEGPTLARGYLNDAEKTAQSFVQRPRWFGFSNETNDSRMYKT